MDLGSLFSGNDNLYKFLFLGGIVMVFFSLVYPLEKKQAIEIEIVTYNKEAEFLNKDIEVLNADVHRCKDLKKSVYEQLEALQKIKATDSTKYSLELSSLKKKFNDSLDELQKKNMQVQIKQIMLKYNRSRILLLKTHLVVYDKYATWMLNIGLFFGFFGLVLWSRSTNRTERLKKEEIRRLRQNDDNARN